MFAFWQYWLNRLVQKPPFRLTNRALPGVEVLEDRCAPAVLTVNTAAEGNVRDSKLSLREAILLANGTLTFGVLTDDEKNGGVPTALPSAVFSVFSATAALEFLGKTGFGNTSGTPPKKPGREWRTCCQPKRYH